MAAGTFMGIVAAVFFGTYPIVNVVLRGVTELLLAQVSAHLLDPVSRLELPQVPPDLLATAAAVAVLVLLAAVLIGLGGNHSLLLVRLISGFAAGFLSAAVLVTTFRSLPPDGISLPSLLPVAVAAAGLCVILARALENASQPQ